jgi:hypothetical protein
MQYVNGSDQQEVRGVRKVVNEKYMPGTMVINVFLLLIWLPFKKKNLISVSAHSSQITVLGCDQTISNGAANTSCLLITHQY